MKIKYKYREDILDGSSGVSGFGQSNKRLSELIGKHSKTHKGGKGRAF